MSVDAPPAPDSTPSGSPEPSEPTRRWGPGRVVIALVVVSLLSMWGYVLYLAFGPGRQPPIDRLDDPAFAVAAEDRCAEALDEIDALPVASATPEATERADVLDEANGYYRSLIAELDGMTELAPAGDQRRYAREWVADWRLHLADREEYADALRSDPGARLLVSEKPGEGRHVTAWIDEFALANRMPSCVSPTDA